MLHGFLWCPWLNCAHSGMVWKISSLCTSSVGTQSCPWPLKLMTSQAVEGMWIPMGSYGRLTGKSVKQQVFWRNALLSIDLCIVFQDYSSPSTRPQTVGLGGAIVSTESWLYVLTPRSYFGFPHPLTLVQDTVEPQFSIFHATIFLIKQST